MVLRFARAVPLTSVGKPSHDLPSMGTKHVTILGVAAAVIVAAARTVADDHAPRSLRMREPRPVHNQVLSGAPARRGAQVPGGSPGHGSAAQPADDGAQPGDGWAAQPASEGSAASTGDGSPAQPASDGSAASPGDGSGAPPPDA